MERHCAISWSPRLSWKQARNHHCFLQPTSQWYDRYHSSHSIIHFLGEIKTNSKKFGNREGFPWISRKDSTVLGLLVRLFPLLWMGDFLKKNWSPEFQQKTQNRIMAKVVVTVFVIYLGHWWLGKDSCQGREFLFFPKCWKASIFWEETSNLGGATVPKLRKSQGFFPLGLVWVIG